MKRILFCVPAFFLTVACGSAKPGAALGGLNSDQAKQFSDLRSAWEDARTAYQTAYNIFDGAAGRADQMAKALRLCPCMPGSQGLPNLPLNQTWSYQRTLNGPTCAVNAQEQQAFQKSATTGNYVVAYTYGVQNSTHGQDFQSLNPLQSFNISGNLNVQKSGSGASTSGEFRINITHAGSNITGNIYVGNSRVDVQITFPSFQMTGSAQWSSWSATPDTVYSIQGVRVSAGDFNTAFDSFAVPDIISKAQEIPGSL